MACHTRHIDTPVGTVTITASDKGLVSITLPNGSEEHMGSVWDLGDFEDHPILDMAASQIEAYFAGERTSFDLPLDPPPLTPFTQRVLRALETIPYGSTASYGDIAQAVGSPNAARAVGNACHKNPLPLVIPCHRVVQCDGSLGGFGGGQPMKRTLLELEHREPTI